MLNYFILLFAGLLSGILSSLFGMGGGLTIVPALLIVLPFFQVPQTIIMHMAIGTSLAIMLITSLNSVRSHHFAGNIKWHYFVKIILYIALGTIIGSIIANLLSTAILMLLFIIFLLVVIVRFIKHLKSSVPTKPETSAESIKPKFPGLGTRIFHGMLTGIISACVGGGSSLIIVPFLKQFGLKIKQAAALSGAFNVFIALVASISYSFLGAHVSDLPKYSTGFIFWPAFLWILINSFIGVPIGTRIANKSPEKIASLLYFLLLLIIFATMLKKYIAV